ncbi:hypothetical protein ACEPPN_008239 [Leptodophora sp. 'Broadleaf-Isolate-01']
MPSSETYSTAAVDGSMDEFAPTPYSPPPKTPVQLAADKALDSQRITAFMVDTSLAPPIASIYPGYYDLRNTAASRCQAAAMNINMFDKAFNKDDLKGNEHTVQTEKRK